MNYFKYVRTAFLTSLFALAIVSPAHASLIYTGQLDWDPNEAELVGGGDWAAEGLSIAWEVELLDDETPTWEYSYTLTVPGKDVSHFIIETSESLALVSDVTASVDLEDEDGVFDTYNDTDQGSSNPNIPGDIWGVKFDLDEDTQSVTLSFTTPRMPVWGDWYAKGGGGPVASWAYNSGFGDPDTDPLGLPPDDSTVTDHIVVPDTVGIPEPATMFTLLFGGALAVWRRRRVR